MKKCIKLITLALLIIIIILILNNKYHFKDTITYNNKTYSLLEYNMDIFTYNYNSDHYLEEDLIHPVHHKKLNIVYFNGDLFVLNKQLKKAVKYYNNDNNYEWFICFDIEDNYEQKAISITNNEIKSLYNMNNIKPEKTITFDEIDMFADILKISKDNIVQGIITLAKVDNIWYYKTEKMTEDDKEYVIPINKKLNKKINKLLKS